MQKPNIGPFLAPSDVIGPNIEAGGWNQSYASPYIRPQFPVDWYTGPNVVDQTRGRHQYRTQPRPIGPGAAVPQRLFPSLAKSLSPTLVPGSRVANGMGAFGAEGTSAKNFAALAAGGAVGFLVARHVAGRRKANTVWHVIGAGIGAVVANQFLLPLVLKEA
jgi:hypothetical protein